MEDGLPPPVGSDDWQDLLQQQTEARQIALNDSLQRNALQQALAKAEADKESWRARAESAERRLFDVLPMVSASCTASEEMLARLAQAKSLADLSDLSRMAFEVRTNMMAIEERANGCTVTG